MKKLNFRHFAVKKILKWGVIAVIASLIVALITLSGVYIAQDAIASLNYSEVKGTLKDSKSDIQSAYILSMFFDSAIYSDLSMDYAAVLKDYDTGEIVCTSEINGYAVIPKKYLPEGSDSLYLKNKNPEFLETVCGYGVMSDVDVSEIYIDGDGFYPGRVTITERDDNAPNLPKGEPVEYDFTPENAAEYEKFEEGFLTSIIGTNSDSEMLYAFKNNKYAVDSGDYFFQSTLEINGKKYNLYSNVSTDILGFSAEYILITTLIVFLMCIVIAVFSAYREYRNYRGYYEMDEYRRNMTTALAHDLKTPLTAIYGYAENLKNNVHTEKKDYYADAVLENVQYMNGIITKTLELASLETGERKVRAETINLTEISTELFRKYQPQTENRNISFTINGQAEIKGDKAMLSQAMENLISNAVKYTADGGKITVETDKKYFSVSNDISGNINADNLSEPLQKSDSSRSNRNGSGIGLSIVKNICKLHKFSFETKVENNVFTATIKF